jgi:endonuclease/exonuclease/phosphatase family metal-dependent hydrolase
MRANAARCIVVGLTAVTLLASCTTSTEDPTEVDAESASATAATSINIMQFNIEYGGEGVDFDSVGKAIEAADADVVAIQEAYANMPEIASDLGWDFYDARTQVVSKYPLISASGLASDSVLVEIDGGVIALFNVHLPSVGYGPFKVAAGMDAAAILEREDKERVPALAPTLRAAAALMEQEIPVFVLGDFNAPSHRDWTSETVGIREHVKFPMDWPTSVAAEAAGLVDVYREVYPDPVSHQGITWPASRPFVKGYNPGPADRPGDRIDLMYAAGAETTSVSIVGEKSSEFTDIPVSPWPTDHRALVASVEVVPGDPPTLVSVDQQLIEVGQERSVRYHADGDDAGWLAVVPAGGAPSEAVIEEPVSDPSSGAWPLPTTELPPDGYEVLLLTDGGIELSRAPFWLVAPGTRPEISTTRQNYEVGESIDVSWENAPGNKWDWVALYARGADPNVAWYKTWLYTDATVAGSATFDGTVHASKWPLRAGQYSVYLLEDDSYNKIAGSGFAVVR